MVTMLPALLRGVKSAYAEGLCAYWLPPIVAHSEGKPIGRITSGDSVIFCCRRGEREIQLTEAFTESDFAGFDRERIDPLTFVPLVRYHPKFEGLTTAFSTEVVQCPLGEAVSAEGLTQLRLAEAEKYTHVTYFLNGRRTEPFPGEQRIVVPSDLSAPLKALPEVVERLSRELAGGSPELITINLATGDLLGHSDSLDTKVECATAVDRTLAAILDLAGRHGYTLAVTADHGLLEDHGPVGGPVNTSHTTSPVPFTLRTADGRSLPLKEDGTLADVAPTILQMLGVKKPSTMVGSSLLRSSPSPQRVLLVILDGWGLGESGRIDPISLAATPCWDRLLQGSLASLRASGDAVGLLPGAKGNSESGHLTLGAGRPVIQDDTRIAAAMRTGEFQRNTAFASAFDNVEARGGRLHLIGMLSKTSSHGSVEYVLELARMARKRGLQDMFVHLITDGRSTRSDRLPANLTEACDALDGIGAGTVVSLFGRGLALDRGGQYLEKTKPVYDALTIGKGMPVEISASFGEDAPSAAEPTA